MTITLVSGSDTLMVCKSFHITGVCRFGSLCYYLHIKFDDNDTKISKDFVSQLEKYTPRLCLNFLVKGKCNRMSCNHVHLVKYTDINNFPQDTETITNWSYEVQEIIRKEKIDKKRKLDDKSINVQNTDKNIEIAHITDIDFYNKIDNIEQCMKNSRLKTNELADKIFPVIEITEQILKKTENTNTRLKNIENRLEILENGITSILDKLERVRVVIL